MKARLLRNVLAVISVSLLLITMGAAFGQLSGRGVFMGMFSTCVLALVTAVIGGAKFGVSSLTGPMTAAVAVVLASKNITESVYIYTLLAASVFLLMFALFKVHKLVTLIPNLVIAGFVNGIALLILISQSKTLDSVNDWIVVLITCLLAVIIHKCKPYVAHPAVEVILSSFFVIVLVSFFVNVFNFDVEFMTFKSFDFSSVARLDFPSFDSSTLRYIIPLGFQLAVIALLDTLLTGLIMQNESKIQTEFKRELTGQSLAMFLMSVIGGVPGAQSTVPSMMFFKEGANHRLAKLFLALTCIAMTFIFLPLIEYVPVAVLAGVIFKVAFDVADFTSIKNAKGSQLILLFGTILSTVFISLNLAVIGFTFIFIAWNYFLPKKFHINDLVLFKETEGLIDEL